MEWNLVVANRIVARVVVSDTMVGWLRPRLTDHRAQAIDEYQDATFDAALIPIWLAELNRIRTELLGAARETIDRSQRLPHDPATRARILDELASRACAAEPHWAALLDAIGLLELAEEHGGSIDALGD
jgi:hypothetical protein